MSIELHQLLNDQKAVNTPKTQPKLKDETTNFDN